MSEEVGGRIARAKSNMVASNQALWKEVNHLRGELSQEALVDDGFLGIDTFIQKARGQSGRKTLWRTRAAKALARKTRLKRLRTAKKSKTTRIFSGSLQATMVYGAACVGIADPELLALRLLLQ